MLEVSEPRLFNSRVYTHSVFSSTYRQWNINISINWYRSSRYKCNSWWHSTLCLQVHWNWRFAPMENKWCYSLTKCTPTWLHGKHNWAILSSISGFAHVNLSVPVHTLHTLLRRLLSELRNSMYSTVWLASRNSNVPLWEISVWK